MKSNKKLKREKNEKVEQFPCKKMRLNFKGIYFIILVALVCFGMNANAQKLSTSYYADIDGNKKSFLSKAEESIEEYHDILQFIKQKYGEESEEYKFMIPDTAKFRELYGFPFFYRKEGVRYGIAESKIIDYIRRLQGKFPMIAISYEQATAYCKWMEVRMNQRDSVLDKSHSKSYTWQYSLPQKADYQTALNHKKTKITQKKSLSPLQVKCKKYCRKTKDGSMCLVKYHYDFIFGLTDNVAEYTQDGMVVEGGENTTLKFAKAEECETPIGFRVKAVKISK